MNKSATLIFFLLSLLYNETIAQKPSHAPLTEEERRGKQIFLTGKSEGTTPIVALLSGMEVSASILPCGSCHGPQGKGNAEGGVQPSDIRWEALTRSYQPANKAGRKHPPYNEKSLKKAITLGIDPGGASLNAVMPRYKLSLDDMNDLIAYIKCLGNDQDGGLTREQIKIVCLLPPGGMEDALVKTSADLIRARFDQINKSGGIYGRKIESAFFSETTGSVSVVEMLRKERPFVLGCSFWPAVDSALLAYLKQEKIPVCAAISEKTRLPDGPKPDVFFLYAGLGEQLASLLEKAQTYGSVALVCPDTPEDRSLIEPLKATSRGSATVETIFVAPGMSPENLARTVSEKRTSTVLFMGGMELSDLLLAFDARGFYPRVFAPGSRAGRQIFSSPIAFNKKVMLAYPTGMDQIKDHGYQHFRELQYQYGLSQNYQNIQMICLASTDLLIDKLKSCNQELSREKLVKEIENGATITNGLIPDLSFRPNKRVGSTLVFLLELDIEKKTLNPAGI